MLRTSEKETEILLGNKHLLGIFFVVAALLGVAFYGGYRVGLAGAPDKKPLPAQPAAPVAETGTAPKQSPTGGETHSFPADTSAPEASVPDEVPANPPLGSPKRKQPEPEPATTTAVPSDFTPQAGQQFLQVAAVDRDEAQKVADVLRKKGFPAHAVPKANTSLYRVIIGPVRDASDLNSKRDALRRTGFREIFVQRY